MADDNTTSLIPSGITSTTTTDTTSSAITNLLNFFQDSENKIDPENENSLKTNGGLIGKSSIYLVNEFKKIFEDGVKTKDSQKKESAFSKAPFKTLAALSAGILGLTTAGVKIYNFFKDPRVIKALADTQVAYYEAMSKAYQTPLFVKGLAAVLVGKELANTVLLFTNKVGMIMGAVASGLSAVAESAAKIYNYFKDPRVIQAIADSQVAYFQAMALAYKSNTFINGMGYVLVGTSGVQELVSDVLTGLGEGAYKAFQILTDPRIQTEITNNQIAYFQSLTLAYQTPQFIEAMGYTLVVPGTLQSSIASVLSGIGQGISSALDFFFNDDVKKVSAQSTVAYLNAVKKVYQNPVFQAKMIDPIVRNTSMEGAISSVIGGFGAGIKRGLDALTSSDVRESNINAITAYNNALISVYQTQAFKDKILNKLESPNVSSKIGTAISSTAESIGAFVPNMLKGGFDAVKGWFTGKEDPPHVKMYKTYYNTLNEIYSSDDFKTKLKVKLYTMDYSQLLSNLLYIDDKDVGRDYREKIIENLGSKLNAYILETESEKLFSNGNFRLNLQYISDVKNARNSQINYSNYLNTIITKLETIKIAIKGKSSQYSMNEQSTPNNQQSYSFNTPEDYGDNINYSYY